MRGPAAAASQVRVIASKILEYLDYPSLRSAELVSTYWRSAVVNGKLYKKLYERNVNNIDYYYLYYRFISDCNNETHDDSIVYCI